jgi:multidrug efflux pump subunit AcrB
MLASYILSRTLVPTLVMYIMRGHEHKAAGPKTAMGRFQQGFVISDMALQMKQLVRVLSSKRGRIVAALIGGGQCDTELVGAFRERFLN